MVANRGRQLGATVPVRFRTVIGDFLVVPIGAGFDAFDVAGGGLLWSYPSRPWRGQAADVVCAGLSAARLRTDGRAMLLAEERDRKHVPSAPTADRAVRPP